MDKKNTGFGPSRVFGEGTEKWEEFLFSSQREELVETRPQVTAAIQTTEKLIHT